MRVYGRRLRLRLSPRDRVGDVILVQAECAIKVKSYWYTAQGLEYQCGAAVKVLA